MWVGSVGDADSERASAPSATRRKVLIGLAAVSAIGATGISACSLPPRYNQWLTAEEQGAMEGNHTWLRTVENALKTLVDLDNSVTAMEQRLATIPPGEKGAVDPGTYQQVLAARSNAWGQLAKLAVASSTGPRLLPPDTLETFFQTARQFLAYGRAHFVQSSPTILTQAHWQELFAYGRSTIQQEAAFYQTSRDRGINYGPAASYSLSVNLYPYPLQLRFAPSGVTLIPDLGSAVRPGIGMSGGSQSGVQTLVMIAGNYQRRYAIGDREFTFEVPASTIHFGKGGVVTITAK
jgi:hypothetical protein